MSYMKYFEDIEKGVVVVSMGPGDLFLEGIAEVARVAGIHTGIIGFGIGGLKKACFTAGSKRTEAEGVFQILNFTGLIADFRPHIHVTMADDGGGPVFGGHLNEGSVVLSIVECSIQRLPGLKLVSDYRDGSDVKLLNEAGE